MKRFDVKRLGRLVSELAVLLALYFLGCQLAAWWHLPIPGGVVGMVLLLLAFALGWGGTGVWLGLVTGLSAAAVLLTRRWWVLTHKGLQVGC